MAIRRAAPPKKYATGQQVKTTAIFKEPHAHGCVQCHGRYEDNCADSRQNGRCRGCDGQLVWEELRLNRLPRDCCRYFARPTDKQDRERYRLSPACDWFICTLCARTHPFTNPAEVQP